MFDFWSIQHFLSGIVAGPIFKKNRNQEETRYSGLVVVAAIAYLWEGLEFEMEKGLLGSRVRYWLHGVELWQNRLFADPLMMLIGFVIAKKYPRCVKPLRLVFITWFLVHVFVFPHAMYLQELF